MLCLSFYGLFVLPYSYLLRPLVIVIFWSNVRARCLDILTFLKDALVVLAAIFGYILFSSILFYVIFKATL